MTTITATRAREYFQVAFIAEDMALNGSIDDTLEILDMIGDLTQFWDEMKIDHEGTPLLGRELARSLHNEHEVCEFALALNHEGMDFMIAYDIAAHLLRPVLGVRY